MKKFTHEIKYCPICKSNYHDDIFGYEEHEKPQKCGMACCNGKPSCYICKQCICIDH